MNQDKKISALKQINEAFVSYNSIIAEYKQQNNTSIAVWQMETVPPELTASFNIISLKIPSFLKADDDKKKYWSQIADAHIIPDTDCSCTSKIPSIPVYNFKVAAGYGEDAAVAIHNETALLLNTLFSADLKKINIEILKEKTRTYETLRKTLRGICSARNSSPSILTQSELSLIFETALVFPPETALEYITPIFNLCKDNTQNRDNTPLKAMLFSCDPFDGKTADLIENEGIIIAEDDSQTGRRSFDISLNYESDYIFYELLDAYSYRPLAPCLRSPEERHELLYKLLRNYSIELVIFLKSDKHAISNDIINYLKIKSMRNGVDVIVSTVQESPGKVRDYLANADLK